jgi:hypothetical protein
LICRSDHLTPGIAHLALLEITMSKFHSPGPWHCEFRQFDSHGRASRPVVRNRRGKKIGSRPADAELMAAGPELVELAASLADCVEMQALQIASALELRSAPYPPILAEARRLLARLRRIGIKV